MNNKQSDYYPAVLLQDPIHLLHQHCMFILMSYQQHYKVMFEVGYCLLCLVMAMAIYNKNMLNYVGQVSFAMFVL